VRREKPLDSAGETLAGKLVRSTRQRVLDFFGESFEMHARASCADYPEEFCNTDFVSHRLQSATMRGIEFEVVWFDQEVIQCKVTCSNGPFRGTTKIYLAHDDLSKAAETLSGFPSNIKRLPRCPTRSF
jgi:hypothetical protein